MLYQGKFLHITYMLSGFPDSSVGRVHLQCRRPWFNSWVGKIHWRRDRLPTPVFLDFSCGSAGKESACNVGDMGWIPRLGRSPGERKIYWLQYFGLENSMDYIVRGVAHSQTWLWVTFTHYVLSRTGPFFKLALLVYLLLLNEIHPTQWLKQNPFYWFAPKSQLDCSTGAWRFTFKMASVTWLARHFWLLTGSLTGAPGCGLSSLRCVSLHMTRLDFSQQGRFRILRFILTAVFPQSAEAEAIGFLKTNTSSFLLHSGGYREGPGLRGGGY